LQLARRGARDGISAGSAARRASLAAPAPPVWRSVTAAGCARAAPAHESHRARAPVTRVPRAGLDGPSDILRACRPAG
jgi:hypothetical protein